MINEREWDVAILNWIKHAIDLKDGKSTKSISCQLKWLIIKEKMTEDDKIM